MKKYLTLLAAGTIFLAGCSKEPAPSEKETVETITVCAGDPETRTSLASDGINYTWSDGDILYVADTKDITHGSVDSPSSDNIAVFTLSSKSDDGKTATFAHTSGASIDAGSTYVVLYSSADWTGLDSKCGTGPLAGSENHLPYMIPATQTYVADGIDTETMPMFACTSDLSQFNVTCLGSILRLRLYSSTAKTVKSIAVSIPTPGSNYAIAGPCAITKTFYTTAVDKCFGPWASGRASSTVTLDCGAGVTLSTDSSNPTVFNIVAGVQNRNDDSGYAGDSAGIKSESNRLLVTVTFDDKSTTSYSLTTLDGNAHTFVQNKVYKFAAKEI